MYKVKNRIPLRYCVYCEYWLAWGMSFKNIPHVSTREKLKLLIEGDFIDEGRRVRGSIYSVNSSSGIEIIGDLSVY